MNMNKELKRSIILGLLLVLLVVIAYSQCMTVFYKLLITILIAAGIALYLVLDYR